MKPVKENIWYASYGSNLLEERFHCYIRGGQPTGSNKNYSGCSDKTLPLDNEELYINSELYFAKKSATWNNGGVGFIKTTFDPAASTLGRMYLITKEQFIDVIKQETANTGDLTIDFDKAISDGSLVFKKDSWYGNIIYLGTQYDYPIFTFTNENNIQELNKPDESYLKMIIQGISETFDYNIPGIVDYLISKKGVDGNYTKNDLTRISEEAIN